MSGVTVGCPDCAAVIEAQARTVWYEDGHSHFVTASLAPDPRDAVIAELRARVTRMAADCYSYSLRLQPVDARLAFLGQTEMVGIVFDLRADLRGTANVAREQLARLDGPGDPPQAKAPTLEGKS